MSGPTVALIITGRGHAHDLDAVLRGVGAQTRPPDELLIVDEGRLNLSTRHTLARLERAGYRVIRRDPVVREGPLNAAVRASGAPLIMLLEAGHVLTRDWLEAAANRLHQDPTIAFVTPTAVDRGAAEGVAADPVATARVLNRQTAMFRRELWQTVGGFDDELGTCAWNAFWLSAAERGLRGTTIDGSAPDATAGRRLAMDPGAAPPDGLERFYGRHLVQLASNPRAHLLEKERLILLERDRHDHLSRRRTSVQGELEELDAEVARLTSELRALGRDRVEMGDLRRTSPLSPVWGLDRGLPLDRHYIHGFLTRHRSDIRGHVLEIKDAGYTRWFGGDAVCAADVLDVDASNERATIIADLTRADAIQDATYDCFILTQTLGVIYDVRAALAHAYRILKPGGVLLCTVPALGRISYEEGLDADFWRFTEASVRQMFAAVFPLAAFQITGYGNVLASAAFLFGLAPAELTAAELDVTDPFFPVVYGIRAEKPRLTAESGADSSAEDAVVTKDPREVVHDAQAIEAYLNAVFEADGLSFDQWVGRFGEGLYRQRNDTIVELVRPFAPRRVLEFACAGGFLAQQLIDRIDTIEAYTCSNFSARMIRHCERQLEGNRKCEVKLIDANVLTGDPPASEWLSGYDTFITTSFEHIQFDRELIAALPRGAVFVFSVAGFDDPEHFRVFASERQIRSRYRDLLDFAAIWSNPQRSKWVVVARRT
jgi:SAM-dependent methyltransferase